MSVKAMSLVWDMSCPSKIGAAEFRPNHKYVLLGYADHADHNGKNIYPAVATIAKKTGYDERTVQRLTHEMSEMGILVDDGSGPRGTNRWFIPFSEGGDSVSPLTARRGDKTVESLGDNPSGDNPSGDSLSPELKELNPININIDKHIDVFVWVKDELKQELKKAAYETWIAGMEYLSSDGRTITVTVKNSVGKTWVEKNVLQRMQELSGIYFKVVVAVETEGE